MPLGRIFISYRSLDSTIARALAKSIESAGGTIYLDERDAGLDGIRFGSLNGQSSVMDIIIQGLREADVLLAIITRRTRGSWWVPAEISAALQMGKEVILVCEYDVRPPNFNVHAVIDNLENLREWLNSNNNMVLDPDALKILESELFSKKSDNIRQASVNALEKIEALWEQATWFDLRLEEPRYAFAGKWMGCRSPRLITTLYTIAAPVYMYKRASPRLDRSELEREVAAILYESWTDDESLGYIEPQIVYEARKCIKWRELREADPRRYWLQGMKPKDLDALFDEMAVPDHGLIQEEAFHHLYLTRYQQTGSLQKPLGLAANALQGFTLDTRPVYARVLAVHALVHHALLKLEHTDGVATMPISGLFELPSSSHLYNSEPARAGLIYLLRKYAPRIRDLGPRDTREDA